MTQQKNSVGLAALVVGIASLPALLVLLGLPLGIVAIGLGLVSLRSVGRGTADNRGQAIAGIACGVVAILVSVLLIARPDS